MNTFQILNVPSMIDNAFYIVSWLVIFTGIHGLWDHQLGQQLGQKGKVVCKTASSRSMVTCYPHFCL